jgi:aryl-alcohol dehydrogenase-like predicted oxidoreductase
MDIENINSMGLSRGHIINAVDNSLARLQTDYIDMLVLNGWDNSVSFTQTAINLHDLILTDKIRYYGVADFKGWQLQRLNDAAR